MAAADAEALRKEVAMVKEKARAYISRLNEEKAALAKELHEKSTILAGVKDKTKAYVEKLNKEKAAAVAALEDQVKQRDDQLLKVKELLRAELASKEQELQTAQAEANNLKQQAESAAAAAISSHRSEPNGDIGSGAGASGEAAAAAAQAAAEDEARSLRGELQRVSEALKASEASRTDAENLLAKSKQSAEATSKRLAAAAEERDSALAREGTLQTSLKVATEEAAAAAAAAETATQEKKAELEEIQQDSASALEREQAAVRSLEERLVQAEQETQSTIDDLRAQLAKSDAARSEIEAAAAESLDRAVAAAIEAAEVQARIAEAAAAVEHESAIEELRSKLAESQATESNTAGAVDAAAAALSRAEAAKAEAESERMESARREEALLAQVVSLEAELGGLREDLRVANEERETAAAAATAEKDMGENGRLVEDGEGSGGIGESRSLPSFVKNTGGSAAEGVDAKTEVDMLTNRVAVLEEELAAQTAVADSAYSSKEEEIETMRERLRAAEREMAELSAELSREKEAAAAAAVTAAAAVAAAEGEAATAAEKAETQAAKRQEAAAAEKAAAEAEAAAAAKAAATAASEEALRAARGDAEKARDEADKQAEELSSRLMGALEQREEGLRREAAAAKEVGRLQGQLEEAAENLDRARAEMKSRDAAAEASTGEWARKVKELEEKREAAETGSVEAIKALEDALTERGNEVERLMHDATGLKKEATHLKAELEARGEALRQAKLDLASVLEDSAAASKKASEARSLLDRTQAEHTETKMRLESETAANAGLKAAVMEANATVSKRVDVLRDAIEKVESERDAAAADASSSKTQLQALQAQVASLLRENAGAKTQAGLKVGDLQQRLRAAQDELSREKESIAERKREMQAYAEAMAKEGETLRATTREAQTVALRATAAEREAKSSVALVRKEGEAKASSLRQTLDEKTAEADRAVAALEEQNGALKAEIVRLQELMTTETGQREEKAQGLEQSLESKIEEAKLHKKKRLEARSMMISLDKTLEAERDGHKAIGHALQHRLVPKAIDQATVLERVVMTAELSVHRLSRAGGVRLATNLQAAQASLARLRGRVAGADDPQVTWHQRQSTDLARVALMGGGSGGSSGMGGLPEDANSSVISDRLDSPSGSAASGDQGGGPGFWRGSNRLGNQAAKDSVYLEKVRRLESEMERVSSGLALVSQSVEQLSELVEVQASLCGGLSVLCCSSRLVGGSAAASREGGSRRAGRGGPAYSTLEMGSQSLVEGE